MNNVDWVAVQNFYDDNHFWRDVLKQFKINDQKLADGVKLGLFKPRTKGESSKLHKQLYPRKHTEESKRLISEKRKKFLIENPDKVPYLMNHYSKGDSYPEQYFENILKKYNINYIKKYRIHTYELDFAILDKKIDIEIDGDQHYLDIKIVKSDKKRTKYLENESWTVIRIKWSDYQKSNKEEYVKNFIDYLNDLTSNKPDFKIIEKIEPHKDYCECGNIKWKSSKNCLSCHNIKRLLHERPSYEQLLKDVNETNYSATGKKYGVSDNSIRKWLKKYKSECSSVG